MQVASVLVTLARSDPIGEERSRYPCAVALWRGGLTEELFCVFFFLIAAVFFGSDGLRECGVGFREKESAEFVGVLQ